MKFGILIIFIICFSHNVFSQEDVIIENIIENLHNETYTSPEIDIIEYYKENPMNLRYISASELSKLPGISYIVAEKILNLVKNNPKISNRSIADSTGITPEAEILLDNCTINIEDLSYHKKMALNIRSRLNQKFKETKGISSHNYLGDDIDLYNRISALYDKYEICGIINKNSGEQNFDEFKSGYFMYSDKQNKIIIGDFYADYGFGSLLWKQFPVRKGSDIISPILKKGSGISAYRSTIDFAYFRGISSQTNFNLSDDFSIRLSGFYSARKKSSTIDYDKNQVTSMYLSGYYRTESEIEKKDNLFEKAISGNIELSSNFGLIFGATVLTLDYSLPINTNSSSQFSGKNGNLFSTYSQYRFSNNMIGAELSFDANSNKFINLGFVHSVENFDLAISTRYIDENFRSPYGYFFGELSYPTNEKGIYTGINYKFNKKINLALYSDIYSSMARTFTIPGIVSGIDLFSEFRYNFQKKSNINLRLRYEKKTDLITNNNTERLLTESKKASLRIDFNFEIYNDLKTRFRAEYSNYSNELNINNGYGLLSFIEIKYKLNNKFSLGSRYTIFSTKDFNSVIYQYEYNMPGLIRSTPLYGEGSRILIFSEFSPLDFLKIYTMLTSTNKNNVNTLGTGNEQINSNYDTRGFLQFELKLR